MEHPQTDYTFFNIRDFTGNFSLSSYALDICPFTFIPQINPNSNTGQVLWDFGDGTTSQSLCATHSYNFSGIYKVTLYVYNTGGDAHTSSFTKSLKISDFVTNTISLSSKSSFIQPAGSTGHDEGIDLQIYNNWQTYNSLSGSGITVNLYASGGDFLTHDQYYSNKYAHLIPSVKFYSRCFNTITSTAEYKVIDSITTHPKDIIYAKVSGDNIVRCRKCDTDAEVAGTYSTERVYISSDKITTDNKWLKDRSAILGLIRFDTSKFDDRVSYENNYYKNIYNRSELPTLNTAAASFNLTITPHLSVNTLTFSQNGIDGIEDNIDTFKLSNIQYTDTRIPFVIRLKDASKYASNYLPTLTAVGNITQPYQIKINVVSGAGVAIPTSAQPSIISTYTDNLSSAGGYWKGYMHFSNSYLSSDSNFTLNDLYLSADTIVNETYNYSDTVPMLGIVGCGDINKSLNISFALKTQFGSDSIIVKETIPVASYVYDTPNYNSTYIPHSLFPEDNTHTGSYYSAWAALKSGILQKYDAFSTPLSTTHLSSFGLTVAAGNSGSNIAIDGNKDIWGSFYNSSSAIKIDNDNNLLAVVSLDNYSAGPIDTDINNNIWMTYSTSLTSKLVKYDTLGNTLSSISLTGGYTPVDLCIDTSNNIWIIAQDESTYYEALSSYNDKIFHHNDASGVTTAVYSISGRSSHITIDTDDHAIFNINVNDYGILNLSGVELKNISTITTTNSSSDITGVGTVGTGDIVFVNNSTKSITGVASGSYVETGNTTIATVSSNSLIEARGDWTGMRWALKYATTTFSMSAVATGMSSNFNIYNSNKYQVEKKSESFDSTEHYKSLRYQEALFDDTVMFDELIGSIVGNLSSSPNTLGKRVYDKISDFVSNNSDVDLCNIDSLYNMYSMLGFNLESFENFRFSIPSNLKRLMDIFSIKQSRLWAGRNQYTNNFDSQNYPIPNNFYGTNLKLKIDNMETTLLTAGEFSEPIVAKSKFSNNYKLLNTNILSAYAGEMRLNQTFPLSSFDAGWGWPLVLPVSATYMDIEKLYDLYTINFTPENSQLEGILNWEDSNFHNLNEALSSNAEWVGKDGSVSEALRYTLIEGTGLFTTSLCS